MERVASEEMQLCGIRESLDLMLEAEDKKILASTVLPELCKKYNEDYARITSSLVNIREDVLGGGIFYNAFIRECYLNDAVKEAAAEKKAYRQTRMFPERVSLEFA